MGLFDWFRRKADPPPEAWSADDLLTDPRCDHYAFAHQALRAVALDNPLGCLAVLASPDARPFLADLVRSVTEFCRDRGMEPSAGLAVDDLTVHRVRALGHPCAVVEMPAPRAAAEAHYVAIALTAEPSENPEARYFTLEKGLQLDGAARAVLCEWTADGTHRNYGDGPPLGVERFLRAIEDLLSGSSR
jgi:hypothetical protein